MAGAFRGSTLPVLAQGEPEAEAQLGGAEEAHLVRVLGEEAGNAAAPTRADLPQQRVLPGGDKLDDGVAYGETFDRATASLSFEGTGVRMTKFEIQKSTGAVTGAAWVGWDGNYAFNADGRKIPVESMKLTPLSSTTSARQCAFAFASNSARRGGA